MAESFGFSEVVLVVACLEDKDVEAILSELVGAASHVVVTRAPSDRAASLDRMHKAALAAWQGTAVAVERAEDVTAALEMAESIVGPGDGILVAGSLVTVGAARDRYMPVEDVDDDVVLEPDDAQAATDEAFEALVAGLDLADDADDTTDR